MDGIGGGRCWSAKQYKELDVGEKTRKEGGNGGRGKRAGVEMTVVGRTQLDAVPLAKL